MLDACPEATFYATPEWLSVVERTYGFKSVPKMFAFEDGQRVLVPLSIVAKYYVIFKQYISVPFYNYGGLFSDRTISPQRIRNILEYLSKKLALSVTVCLHPLSETLCPEEFRAQDYTTHLLCLQGGFDEYWKPQADVSKIILEKFPFKKLQEMIDK